MTSHIRTTITFQFSYINMGYIPSLKSLSYLCLVCNVVYYHHIHQYVLAGVFGPESNMMCFFCSYQFLSFAHFLVHTLYPERYGTSATPSILLETEQESWNNFTEWVLSANSKSGKCCYQTLLHCTQKNADIHARVCLLHCV